MSTNCPTPKKPRAAAQVWKKFYLVGRTDTFFIGKTKMTKVGYITAVIASTGDKRYVNPLKRVRTAELVGTRKGLVQTAIALSAPAKPAPFVALPSPECIGTTSQPSSDNGITGPTS
jgi:hypothetical protein